MELNSIIDRLGGEVAVAAGLGCGPSAIKEQRYQLDHHPRDNLSLKALIASATADAYQLAAVGAQRETGIGDGIFPEICPFTFEQMTDRRLRPE